MLGRLDLAPRIAGDVPAVGRLLLQRIEIFGLAGQQVEHLDALEDAALAALAHELGEVGAEQRGEDRVGLGVGQRLRHRAGIDLAERRRLLGDELDVGLLLLEELLERRRRRLAVLVVRIDDRPALLLELGGVGNQHRRLHVGRGAQAEGVGVAGIPDDLVGQRLGGDEQRLALLGEVGDGEADVRREGADQEGDLLAAQQLLGDAHRVGRIAVVVAAHDLDLLAQHAARGIDLLDRELPALLVGLEEGGEDLVAVELAELDRVLRGGRQRERSGHDGRDAGEQTIAGQHEFPLREALNTLCVEPSTLLTRQKKSGLGCPSARPAGSRCRSSRRCRAASRRCASG